MGAANDLFGNWLKRIDLSRFPVLETSRQAASDPARRGPAASLAPRFRRDPFLSARIFAEVHGNGRSRIGGLDQAPVLMGEERFLDLARTARTVSEVRTGATRDALFMTLRRAHHGACLAEELAKASGYGRPQEFYFSGLFYRLGEMAIRLLDPALARRVDEAAGPQVPWGGVERRGLGFNQAALSLELCRTYNLPQLLLEGEDQPKAKVVLGAAALTDEVAADANSARTRGVFEEVAVWSHRAPENLRRDLYRSAVPAACAAVETYPLGSDAHLVEFFPRPLSWAGMPAFKSTAPHTAGNRGRPPASPVPQSPESGPEGAGKTRAAPRGKQPPAAPPPRPRAPAPGAAGPPASAPRGEASPPAGSTPQEVIQGALEALAGKAGLSRAFFAMLSADRKRLEGRFYRGFAERDPLRPFRAALADNPFFVTILSRSGQLWANPDNAERVHSQLGGDTRALFQDRDFFVASVVVNDKPVGLLYADGQPLRARLDGKRYQGFRGVVSEMRQGMEALMSRRG